MRKILFFAAVCATVAACTKENMNEFAKGQTVTLNVHAETGETTRVTSALNASTDAVEFKWEAGDVIRVTVNGSSAEFTLTEGAGTTNGTFEGTMPADGTTFDVQYPYNDPTIASQTYFATEAVPHNLMKFAATGCSTSSESFSLTAQNAALRLNLWGNKKIGKIVVTNNTSSDAVKPSYTLHCGMGATIGSTMATATPFFFVVPAGDWNFSAEIFDDASTPAPLCTYTKTSTTRYFTGGQVLNMPPKEVKGNDGIKIGDDTWEPENIGTDEDHPFGLLFQWGRYYGQAYDGEVDAPSIVTLTSPLTTYPDDTDENRNVYYKGMPNWYAGTAPSPDDLWNDSSIYNPCPDGWELPTKEQWQHLINNVTKEWVTGRKMDGTPGGTVNGYMFDGKLFFPAAGTRTHDVGTSLYRNFYGFYQTGTIINDTYAWAIDFDNSGAYLDYGFRGAASSIRCVKE